MSRAALRAQEGCQPPNLKIAPSAPNIFSAQQEVELGEIVAQRLGYLRVSDDPVLTAYLGRIGDRLARYLPATAIHFQYFVMDSATPDAFSVPGGRIYISRGMVGQFRSPDEVAAILGHEMGHVVTHQGALDLTFLLEHVLGVTHVTDRLDIQQKIDDLQTNRHRDPSAMRHVARRRQPEQLLADQVGLYAMTAAGYSPEAYPEIFKRIVNDNGATGNWLAELLHTSPEEIRLQDMVKAVESMPQGCIAHRVPRNSRGFLQWQAEALDFTGWGKRVKSLHNVLAKVTLAPLTVGEVRYVRFSPDGSHLLAAKGDRIYVFNCKPFAFVFRIPDPDASRPIFTADSQSVAFVGTGGRVEVWDIASRRRIRTDNIQLDSSCFASSLSPDARTVACLLPDGRLDLVRLSSGLIVFEKRRFSEVSRSKFGHYGGSLYMAFSRDGRYFVAHSGSGATVVIDVASGSEIRVTSGLKRGLEDGFVFLSRDRLLTRAPFELHGTSAGYNRLILDNPNGLSPSSLATFSGPSPNFESASSTLYEFPSGKVIGKVPVGSEYGISAVTNGNYLLIGPLKNDTFGMVDLKSGKLVHLLFQHAVDVYGGVYAHQILGGDLGLFSTRTGKVRARVSFPPVENGSSYLNVIASPELKWLAASQGAVWDLANGNMIYHVRPFQSGRFDDEKAFYANFLAFRNSPRAVVRLDLTRRGISPQHKIEYPEGAQYGLYSVVAKPRYPTRGLAAVVNPCRWKYPDFDPMDCDATYEIYDVPSGHLLWSRDFPKEVPRFRVEPDQKRVVIYWPASDSAVRDEIKKCPRLKAIWETSGKRPGMSLVEVLSLADGSLLRAMLVETGMTASVLTAGEHLLVRHPGYTDVLSLATGEKEGEIPGWPRAISPSGRLVSVRGAASNELDIYDSQSRMRLGHFAFPSDVDFDQFSRDGRRLLVLTTNQTVYLLDMTALRGGVVADQAE